MIMIYFIRFVANLPAIRNLTEHKTQRQDRRTTNQRVERYGQVDKEPAAAAKEQPQQEEILITTLHFFWFTAIVPLN